MVAAIDCEEHQSNGGGCVPLHIVADEQRRHATAIAIVKASQEKQDEREGRMLAAVGEAKSAAIEARNAAKLTDERAARIEAAVCRPANNLLIKYQGDSDPPPLLDADDGQDVPTSTSIHIPHLAERRIRKEQAAAAAAEQARIRLEAEKLVAEERAARLADQKAIDDKRHARNMAILAALAALGTAAYPAFSIISKLLVGH